MQPSASQTSLIGFLLEDRYRVVREIGRGGMGVVYEAEHVELGKRVAIKLMLEKYAEDKEAVARFRREAFAATRIGNPHIIDVSHIGTAPDGRAFVVMELLVGMPLGVLIEKVGALAPTRAINIMRQVLRAVGAAHAKGIVHRDLKPDNIFLLAHDDQHDFVKLLDFGISKMLDSEGAIAQTKLTSTGTVMGTPLYMAPEQAMGAVTDHQVDLYACGVILYEMLSGRPPFEGATYPVLIAKLLTAEPTNLRELQPHLPARLITATHKALEKEPAKRWATAEHFLNALPMMDRSPSQIELGATMGMDSASMPIPSQAVTASSAHAHPARAPGSKRALLVVAGAFAVVAAAGGTYLAMRGGSDKAADQVASVPPAPTITPLGSAAPTGGSLGGAAAAVDAKKDPPVPPPTPTPAQVGKLEIKSNPPGAEVTIDNVKQGPTPREITLAPGRHHIHLELAKYAPIDDDEDVSVGERTSVVLPLQLAVAHVNPYGNGGQPHGTVQHTIVTPYDAAPGTTNVVPNPGGPSTPPPIGSTTPPPDLTKGPHGIGAKPPNTGHTGDTKPTGSKPNPYDD